ncbi:ATP synthase regulation domain-containing protein [Phthorimaea operculella]|nr:ATP synthase regulation domain-containing protein [Phthorimaea operculella]
MLSLYQFKNLVIVPRWCNIRSIAETDISIITAGGSYDMAAEDPKGSEKLTGLSKIFNNQTNAGRANGIEIKKGRNTLQAEPPDCPKSNIVPCFGGLEAARRLEAVGSGCYLWLLG